MNISKSLNCFTAYDIRGKIGHELDEDIAYKIGFGAVQSLNAKTVIVGFDARKTSPNLGQAVANGICDAGAEVFEIGLAGTEETYAAVSEFKADAGIEITASHNPIEYNGMKIVKQGSQPLSDQEFKNIKRFVEANDIILSSYPGVKTDKREEARATYIEKIIKFVDLKNLKPLKIVINSGNGAAGPTIDFLKRKLIKRGVKTNFVYQHHDPDSSFPNGIPNPMIEENRLATAKMIVREGADFGVAFDGDFDRCFIFDHLGCFTYSKEEGTVAGRMQNQVNADIMSDRQAEIMGIQKKISSKSLRNYVGQFVPVLVKGRSEESELLYEGRLSTQAPEVDGLVYINDGPVRAGEIQLVEITDSFDYDLVGRVIAKSEGH